ncbi:MAG: PAS domain-containing sensor histidine kinase, partial [Chloroflexota bacterium]
VAEIVQIGVVDAVAVFVGQRVDREVGARRRAEAMQAALISSEMKYRGLFESSPIAVLVLDPAGIVVEANPTAAVLFGRAPAGLNGSTLAGLLGQTAAEQVFAQSPKEGHPNGDLRLGQADGSEVYLQPSCRRIGNGGDQPVVQLLLRDVTEEHQRQAGLRAYAAHILRAQEEERKRIAQDLHDETVQEMILLCRQLDHVEDVGEALPCEAVARLHEARGSAEKIAEGLRGFARVLRPATLDDLGLVSSLRRLLLDVSERGGLEGKLRVLGEERRLTPDVELALFRITQEALRNVEHHAQAAKATVVLDFAEGHVALQVRDDGMGFAVPPELDFAASCQMGLLGMQERVESLGGKIRVESSPASGTVVEVRIPVEVQPASASSRRSHSAHR